MGIDFCHILSASIFQGDANAVKFSNYTDNESALDALTNGMIDVLVGIRADFALDFGTTSGEGVTFTVPYFYGNETWK
jgi:hypothetical protein